MAPATKRRGSHELIGQLIARYLKVSCESVIKNNPGGQGRVRPPHHRRRRGGPRLQQPSGNPAGADGLWIKPTRTQREVLRCRYAMRTVVRCWWMTRCYVKKMKINKNLRCHVVHLSLSLLDTASCWGFPVHFYVSALFITHSRLMNTLTPPHPSPKNRTFHF